MSFPQGNIKITNQKSVRSILEAEAGILDCMARFFGTEGGVVDMIQCAHTVTEKVELLNAILPAYSNKENSIAKVMRASAENLAADENINPAYIDCPPLCKSSCYCK